LPARRLQPGFYRDPVGNTATYNIECDPAPVPEPTTLGLFGAALAGLGFLRRRKTV
jgi:hypothetical protein